MFTWVKMINMQTVISPKKKKKKKKDTGRLARKVAADNIVQSAVA